MTEPNDRLQRALDLVVYAPLGASLFLRDTAPGFVQMFVARGRAEVGRRHEQVQQRITTARSLGQVALAFGVPVARERVQQQLDELRNRAGDIVDTNRRRIASTAGRPAARPAGDGPPGAASPSVPAANGNGSSTASSAGGVGNGAARIAHAAARADLPIPGYDALSASQVVERLIGLGAAELEAIRTYEAANRNRRTILGKIDQLTG
jgi:hypothetical protein